VAQVNAVPYASGGMNNGVNNSAQPTSNARRGIDAAAVNDVGPNTIGGTVESIGKDGKFSLKTDADNVKLRFPPDWLAGVKKGDTVTVHASIGKP
jgi:hypothetical protein